MRTAAQFGGDAWRNYDEAFRRETAARGLTDWSHMNVKLYNVHTTYNRFPRSSVRPPTGSSSTSSSFFAAPGTLVVVQPLAATVDIGMPVIVSVVGAPIVASNAPSPRPRCHPPLAP